MLKYHKNVEDHRFPHFQHHKKERKITMKKRCLSLLLTLCLLAALAGAKYVAPYVNRVDAQGGDGIRMVQELQSLLEMHAPESKVLAASFKTPRQALDCLLAGCEAITLPLDVAQQMLGTPAVESAIEKFEQDWNNAFGTLNL